MEPDRSNRGCICAIRPVAHHYVDMEIASVVGKVVVNTEAQLWSVGGGTGQGSDTTSSIGALLDTVHEALDALLLKTVPGSSSESDQTTWSLNNV